MKQQVITSNPAIIALRGLALQMCVSTVTLWRHRKNGWLDTVNIAGKPYVTAEALDEYKRRAVAGEFAKSPNVPRRYPDGATPPTPINPANN